MMKNKTFFWRKKRAKENIATHHFRSLVSHYKNTLRPRLSRLLWVGAFFGGGCILCNPNCLWSARVIKCQVCSPLLLDVSALFCFNKNLEWEWSLINQHISTKSYCRHIFWHIHKISSIYAESNQLAIEYNYWDISFSTFSLLCIYSCCVLKHPEITIWMVLFEFFKT